MGGGPISFYREFAAAGLTAELGAVALLRARLHVDEQDWAAAERLAELELFRTELAELLERASIQ